MILLSTLFPLAIISPSSEESVIILSILLILLLLGTVVLLLGAVTLFIMILRVVRYSRELRAARVSLRKMREAKEELVEELSAVKESLEDKQNDLRRAGRVIAQLRKENFAETPESAES